MSDFANLFSCELGLIASISVKGADLDKFIYFPAFYFPCLCIGRKKQKEEGKLSECCHINYSISFQLMFMNLRLWMECSK